MKKTIILLLFYLIQGIIIGQYVVIDTSCLGGISIPFQETTLSTWPCNYQMEYHYIDLDQDSINDVRFHLECHISGTSYYYFLDVLTYNYFFVHTDTSYQEYVEYINNNQVCDTILTTTVVREYLWGDTIYDYQTLSSSNTYIFSYYVGYFPTTVIYSNICQFLGDTAYVAFTRDTGQNSSIYYIELFCMDAETLHLLSAKTNAMPTSININSLSTRMIYPNPVSENIYFEGSYYYFEIYTLQGVLIKSGRINENQRVIEVSGIPKGYYILKLQNENTEFVTKFIKL
ncbi:MAG: T9SS type A sorting domain-containing protein [Bacteroidales bacterium]|nr:T9SS type A sorting domain-containing protein [Bacteroidales bacterium]